MKGQFSLRTLILVMTLGGPLLAGGAKLASEAARYLSPYEEVHCCDYRVITWDEAIWEAQKVQTLSTGYQRIDKRRLESRSASP